MSNESTSAASAPTSEKPPTDTLVGSGILFEVYAVYEGPAKDGNLQIQETRHCLVVAADRKQAEDSLRGELEVLAQVPVLGVYSINRGEVQVVGLTVWVHFPKTQSLKDGVMRGVAHITPLSKQD